MGKRGPKPGTNVHGEGQSWKTADFSSQREAFAEWMATPKSSRKPKTKKAFSEFVGVSLPTLTVWSKDFMVIKRIGKIRAEQFALVDLGGVLATLVEISTDSTHRSCVAAAKTLLDWSEKLLEDVETQTNYQEMTDAELRENLVEGIDELDGRMADELKATG